MERTAPAGALQCPCGTPSRYNDNMNEGPSQLNKVKCPQCKYDLRGQLGVPMPRVVRCPECGQFSQTFEFRHVSYAPRRRQIPIWSIAWPLPTFIVAAMVLTFALGDVAVMLLLYRGLELGLLFTAIHASTIAFKFIIGCNDGYSQLRCIGLACYCFIATALFDSVIVMTLSFLMSK